MPPEIGPELEAARKAWHTAEDKTAEMRDPKFTGAEELDKLIDSRDKAYEDAITWFEKALKKDPNHPQALAEFGRYWFSRRDFLIARSYLEEAWSSPATKVPYWLDASGFWSSLTSNRTLARRAPVKDPAVSAEHCGWRAENAFTEADKADLLRTLGGIAERAGETDAALAYYRAAMSRFGADPRNRVSLAVAYCGVGNLADAIALLEPWDKNDPVQLNRTATADFPKDRPDILALGLYTLALAKEESGYFDDALALYRRAEEASKQGFAAAGETAESARMAIARLEDKLDEFADNDVAVAKQLEEYAKVNAARAQAHMPALVPPKTDRLNFADALNFAYHALSAKSQAMRDPEFVSRVVQTSIQRDQGD